MNGRVTNMQATLINNMTGERIEVRSTTRHPASSYGFPVWVDKSGVAYCQVGLPNPMYTVELDERATSRLDIGIKLAKARAHRGLSTRELAEITGISNSNISKIERGEYNVSIDILCKLCRALGVNIELI